MAIKVSGTTVIDDSRGLTNIATVDATTAAAIGAAGVGGGGTHEFTASGAISAGDVVVLNSNGTVSQVSQDALDPPERADNTYTISEATNQSIGQLIYHENTQQFILVYFNPTNGNLEAKLGPFNSSTGQIEFGGAQTISANADNSGKVSILIEEQFNQLIVFYKDSVLRVRACTVSSKSLTAGSQNTIESVNYYYIDSTWHAANNVVICTYVSAATNYIRACSMTVNSGRGFNIFTPQTIDSVSAYESKIEYALESGGSARAVISYSNNNNSTNYVRVCTYSSVGGNLGTIGSAVSYGSGRTDYLELLYAGTQGQVHLVYSESGTNTGKYVPISITSNSATIGSSSTFVNSGSAPLYLSASVDSNDVICAFWRDPSVSSNGRMAAGKISSGTVSSWSSSTNFNNGQVTYDIDSAYDPASNQMVVTYLDGNNSYARTYRAVTASGDSGNWIGFATENISDTASGDITILGGVNSNQTGLTAGSTYYVTTTGGISTTSTANKIGKALSSTEILVTEGNA